MNMFYRIYGDNIIECFRIINILKMNRNFSNDFELSFLNTSTIQVRFPKNELQFHDIIIELIPGFDKSRKKRWHDNILDMLKDSGGDLDETADAIITRVNADSTEEFLIIIEFCSALQAGNQAWQRSGRAYSIGKTKVPYLYIVDFTRYELDSNSRERKALRFPNAIVPYSYVTYTDIIDTPVLQAYFKSEEFDPEDPLFVDTDFNDIFAENDVSELLTALILGQPSDKYVSNLKTKNLEMVYFLAKLQNGDSSLNRDKIISLNTRNLYDSITSTSTISFKKIIAEKSVNGNLKELNDLVQKYSTGVFSSSLPFGIITHDNLIPFTDELSKMYTLDMNILNRFKSSEKMVVAMMKGFKPAGDDNRPDRGILPLIRMLFGEDVKVLTILYGPIIGANYDLLKTNQAELARRNGLWQTIVYMSDFLLLDSPIIKSKTTAYSQEFLNLQHNIFNSRDEEMLSFRKLNLSPVGFREDDVDTLLYTLLNYNVKNTFFGLCNPPGGDWSGFSLIHDQEENRWLSLPRVSKIGYKRPDHVIQFLNYSSPLLLVIESKDKVEDLEINIGERLNGYIKWLLQFTPNVTKSNYVWSEGINQIDSSKFTFVSAGSFIDKNDSDHTKKLAFWKCDLIFSFKPTGFKQWSITVFHNEKAESIYIVNQIKDVFETSSVIKNIKLVRVSPVKI